MALFAGVSGLFAQDNYKSVKGYVINKYGNPIPGAEVTATGGGESTITDADGSFSMNVPPLLQRITATYDGMKPKTLKINTDKELIFRLTPPRKRPAFINVVGGPSLNNHSGNDINVGLMGGMLGKWGGYVKAFATTKNSNFGFSLGGIKSIYKRTIFGYLGVGCGKYHMAIEHTDVSYHFIPNTIMFISYVHSYTSYHHGLGFVFDGGFIIKTSDHFNLTIGYSYLGSCKAWPEDYFWNNVQVGVGYVF